MLKKILLACAAGLVAAPVALAQQSSVASAPPTLAPAAEWATHAQNRYQVSANVTYLTASGYESKLDVYRRRDATTQPPPW